MMEFTDAWLDEMASEFVKEWDRIILERAGAWPLPEPEGNCSVWVLLLQGALRARLGPMTSRDLLH